jgi:hypothetical protein
MKLQSSNLDEISKWMALMASFPIRIETESFTNTEHAGSDKIIIWIF